MEEEICVWLERNVSSIVYFVEFRFGFVGF